MHWQEPVQFMESDLSVALEGAVYWPALMKFAER
jgi:hypothetical protein